MNLAEKNRKFLEKLRNLPENKKKIILWTIVAIAALTMGFFWVLEIKNSLSVADKEMQKIKIPQIITPDIQNPILQSITGQPTDLKTYTSDKYNFEFKYLPDLTVEISPIQDLDIGLSTLAFKQNTTYPI